MDCKGAVSVWLIVSDGMVKGLGGWASGLERLAEGSTVVEGARVEVWAGVWEVVVVDRKVGSIFAERRAPSSGRVARASGMR